MVQYEKIVDYVPFAFCDCAFFRSITCGSVTWSLKPVFRGELSREYRYRLQWNTTWREVWLGWKQNHLCYSEFIWWTCVDLYLPKGHAWEMGVYGRCCLWIPCRVFGTGQSLSRNRHSELRINWIAASWFTSRPPVFREITLSVWKYL